MAGIPSAQSSVQHHLQHTANTPAVPHCSHAGTPGTALAYRAQMDASPALLMPSGLQPAPTQEQNGILDWLRKLRLHKYYPVFKQLTMEKVCLPWLKHTGPFLSPGFLTLGSLPVLLCLLFAVLTDCRGASLPPAAVGTWDLCAGSIGLEISSSQCSKGRTCVHGQKSSAGQETPPPTCSCRLGAHTSLLVRLSSDEPLKSWSLERLNCPDRARLD